MSRNGSGTYNPPSSSWNPAVAGTAISPTDWNNLLSDIGGALTGSLASDGQTTASARIPFAAGLSVGSGTVSLPAVNFASDPDCGLYRIGANNIGLAVNGAKVLDVATTGLTVTGDLTVSSTVPLIYMIDADATPRYRLNGSSAAWRVQYDVGNTGVWADTLSISGSGLAAFLFGNEIYTTANLNLSTYAPLASPAFTGTPTVPTAATATNTTQAASTAYVKANLTNYLTTATAASTYAPLASPTFTGTPSIGAEKLMRVATGTAANSGRVSFGTAAPGTLALGEIYLQHSA